MACVCVVEVVVGDQVRRGIEALLNDRVLRPLELCMVCVGLGRSPVELGLLALVENDHPINVALRLEHDGGHRGKDRVP